VTVPISAGADGFVGFFLRVAEGAAPQGSLTTQIVLHHIIASTDAGVARTVVADGQWHYYDWNLDDPSHWTVWRDGNGNPVPASDGVLPSSGGGWIDSIVFRGGNSDVELFLDTVAHNRAGSLGQMVAPEPAAAALAPLFAAALLRRRR
jgi:hypothetical protein